MLVSVTVVDDAVVVVVVVVAVVVPQSSPKKPSMQTHWYPDGTVLVAAVPSLRGGSAVLAGGNVVAAGNTVVMAGIDVPKTGSSPSPAQDHPGWFSSHCRRSGCRPSNVM